ncbi:MAG: hypothetical protein ACI396_10900 [Acutalibacteraceae bacterium]
MKSKVFKKIIAVVCATALILTAASAVLFATVSAETTTGRAGVSRLLIDFDDNPAKSYSSDGDDPAKTLESSTLSDSFSAWKEISGTTTFRFSGKGQTARIVLPDGWTDAYTAENGKTYSRPNAISMNMCSSTTISPKTAPTLAGKALTLIAGASISSYKVGTVVYKIPTDIDLTAGSTFVFSAWATNQTIYLDNIKLEYYDGFNATFEGTETAVLSTAVDSIFQDNTAGQTSITLPTATLDGGKTLAGWVTADDSATVLPAGTSVPLEDDTTFYAVATDRGPFPTPDAPTVASTTFNSVTLTALGSEYVYSMDGETWQTSNVFTSLAPSTEYTFYTKHIATTAYDESAASAGTKATTEPITEFVFSKEYVTLSDNTANLQFNTGLAYKCITANVAADKSTTVTTNYTVAPGVYDLTLYARSYGTRAQVNIEVNGTVVGESVNTSATGSGGDNVAFALSPITITETTVLTIKITTVTSGNLYLNSLKLTKTADYTPGIVMDEGASMRIDNKTYGIRFSATVPTSYLVSLKDSGAEITDFGMIIAPAASNLTTDTMIVDNAVEMKAESVDLPADKNAVLASYGRADAESDQSGTVTQIIGSLVEIKPDNADKEYVARAYIKYTDVDGVHYIYSNIGDARSIATVAAAIKADTDYYSSLCAEHKEAVDQWIPNSSEATE